MRAFLVQVFEQAGYHVIAAASGREAWSLLGQYRPQCVLLDVVLPDVSGFHLCRHLRARLPSAQLAIVLISTKGMPTDQRWGLRQGADRYLVKPFSAEVVLQTVEDLLRERHRSDAP